MIADIRKLITAQPFVPFTITVADGRQLHVPTVDHISISGLPIANRFVIWMNDGDYHIVRSTFVTTVTAKDHETKQ